MGSGVVQPVLAGGFIATAIGTTGSSNFSGLVGTWTFPVGTSPQDQLAVIGLFYVSGGATAITGVTATYGGLPCTVSPLTNTGTTTNQQLFAVMCVPPTNATFANSKFVVTFTGGTTLSEVNPSQGILLTGVSPSAGFSSAQATNTFVAGNPATITVPAVAGNAGDMLLSLVALSVSAALPMSVASSPSFIVQQIWKSSAFNEFAVAYRQLKAIESDAVEWLCNTTIVGQNGCAISWDVAASGVSFIPGQASGGQSLTPNNNVNAPAGIGGDRWGANGGGITPIGGGISGQGGWDERIAIASGDGQLAANYETSPIPLTVKGAPTLTVMEQQSNTTVLGSAPADSLPGGGANKG